MSGLLLKNVNKIYPGGQQAIRDFSLEIKEREFLILAGPEGCGKSTLLRMIAGLEEITSGSLYIDGTDMTDAEPRERNIAMLFKNSVLYPDMTVSENLSFSLRMAKIAPDEIEKRIRETANLLELEGVLDKMPSELTTKEVYQALLGRALMRRPGILLLDSTITDLDEDLQKAVRQEFLNIHEKLDMTVIYVTNNQKTAMTLGTRMVVMNEGMICQDDTPQNLLLHPNTSLVAGVVGYPPMNFFSAVVSGKDDAVWLDLKCGRIPISAKKGRLLADKGYLKKDVTVGIRADALSVLGAGKKGGDGILAVKSMGSEVFQSQRVLRFSLEETEGICLVEKTESFAAGESLLLKADGGRVQIFDRENEQTVID